MTDLSMLLIYLGIAAVIAFVANMKGMGRFRRGLDRVANRHVSNLGHAKRIAMIGEGRDVSAFAGRSVHRLTIGIRVLSTVLTLALVRVIDNMITARPGAFVAEGYEMPTFVAVLALTAWYLIFIWTYRLVRQDNEISVPGLLPGRRTYDLRKLVRIEDDGAYMLRLYFADGRKAEILKYVEGRVALVNELERYADRSSSPAASTA